MECVGSLVRPGLVCGASSRRFRASAVLCLEAVKLVFGPGQLGKIVWEWSDGVGRGARVVVLWPRDAELRVACQAGLSARGNAGDAGEPPSACCKAQLVGSGTSLLHQV
jgi:hypothetical protein